MAHIFVDAHGRELPMGANDVGLYELGDPALLDDALKPKLFARLWSRQSPSLDAQGPTGATPLTFAAAKGFVSDVETLLRHGATPEARDAWGNTALATAARAACGGDVGALICVRHLSAMSSQETLSEVGAFWDRTARDIALAAPEATNTARAIRDVLQELRPHIKDPQLLHGWNPPTKAAQPLTQEEAQVALFKAVMVTNGDRLDGGYYQKIVAALEAGGDPNQRLTRNLAAALPASYAEGVGQSALEMVVKNLDVPFGGESDRRVIDPSRVPLIVKTLLERGADPKQPTSDGRSLLHSIRFAPNEVYAFRTMEMLVGAGADVNEQQASGLTLLDSVVALGDSYNDGYCFFDSDVARLMDAGAQLNRSSPGVEPTIVLALQPSSPDKKVVETLLRHGASPNEINKDGVPLLSAAAERNEDEIALLLLSSGAEPNPSVAPEIAPLMIAAKRGQPQVVEALLKAGARTDVRTEWGETPLSAAASYGQIAAVEALMPHCTDDQIALAAHAAVHARSEEGEEAKRLRAVDNLAKRLNREQREPLETKSQGEMDSLGWPPAEKQRVMPFLCTSREERAISESIGLGKRAHEALATPADANEAIASSAQASPRPASPANQMVVEPQVEKRRGMRL